MDMVVARLMKLVEDDEGQLQFLVRWKALTNSEDSLEPLQNFYEDVSELLQRLLDR